MPLRQLAMFLALLAGPALGQEQAMLDRALDQAVARFEAAYPSLGDTAFGVDVAAYRDALTLNRFRSARWGGTVRVDLFVRDTPSGSCGRFAAFVRLPPEDGTVRLVLCPQFFSPGADALRVLTVLHEMVHVVAGDDECKAMAFTARVEHVATGSFTPVDSYWRASGCGGSGYQLPD